MNKMLITLLSAVNAGEVALPDKTKITFDDTKNTIEGHEIPLKVVNWD